MPFTVRCRESYILSCIRFFGSSTFGFHLLNVGLHALNAILIFLLGVRLGFRRPAAWLAALLWAMHPIHTEAVTYQSATADPLYAAFLLGGLLVLFPERNIWRVVGAAVLYIGGLLSKETAIVFPALLVACSFLRSERRWSFKTYLWTLPFWVLALGYLVARKTFLDFDNTFQFYKTANVYTENFLYRVYTFLATLPSYAYLFVWPQNLHMDRNFPVFASFFYWPVAAGTCFMLVGGFLLWWERKSARPLLAFAFLWFLAAHAPHMGVFLPVNAIFLEHWLYLRRSEPMLGFCEWVAGWEWLPGRLAVAGAAAIALALGTATFYQNQIWATPISFYSHILASEPRVARAQNNLAMALSESKDAIKEAIE